MTYERTNERMAFNELYARWTEFMKYANHKVKTIPDGFLREYCNFVSNVALRFGSVNAIYNCPEIPGETLGQYVRDYEKALVEWSGYLAGIEARERKFREEQANLPQDPISVVVETPVCTEESQRAEPPACTEEARAEPCAEEARAEPQAEWLVGGGVVSETPKKPKKSKKA